MKVLFVNTLYFPNIVGGAEQSLQILAETLTLSGHDVVVISLHERKQSKSFINGVKVYYVPLRNFYYPFKGEKKPFLRIGWHLLDIFNYFMYEKVKEIVAFEKPDIIHTHNLSGFSVCIWKVSKLYEIPIVHTLRDYYLLCHLSTMYRKKRCLNQCKRCFLISEPKKIFSNIPNAVTGVSTYILNRHLEHGFFKNVKNRSVIPNPIKKNQKEKLKKCSKNLHIGYLGRISPEKGVEFFLDCAMKIAGKSFRIHIAGTGKKEYVEKLKKKYTLNTQFYGYINADLFFQKINLLVVPSLWNEPFGRIIIEAFSNGIPVIGSKTGGIADLISEGKNGFLYPPDDKEALINLLNKFMNNDKDIKSLVVRTKNNLLRFSPENICEQYLNIYNEIV
ncbi:glycosyl transferase [Desulfosarcina alkanivorans]|uniref:Glycosyl transferase n=1 Tax=Desulfosarcina alkanivorans TaxID=571177 RepID=A0A5K7YDS3_9BACT|nr:glycosyltransferase family 4 protein [Desulfosarcina alkanivorans]BBO67218.1 glycosyl transferase [Desulfosarcina alkanivorans]